MSRENRLKKLRQLLNKNEIEAILISQPENRYYLAGFDGSAGLLLISQQQKILATDFRYLEQAKSQAPDYEIFPINSDVTIWLPKLVAELKLGRLGFEAGDITFAQYQKLNQALAKVHPQFRLVPLDGLVESLRLIKEPEEVELMTKAAEITDSAFSYIQGEIGVGMSEREVAWKLEKFLRESGSQTIPFDVMVASGPNSTLPHAKPSPRAIQTGEPIIIDIGARIEGYSSDLSRTLCLGTPDSTFSKVYDIVLGAQLTAIATIREDMSGDEADSLAREVIKQAGYGQAFGHGLGHGIGLAPHEPPRLGPDSPEMLVSGMIFTVEPAVYLKGWGGVRIEDMVIMEDSRPRAITRANK